MQKGFEYTFHYFRKIFFEKTNINLIALPAWSDDHWFLDQQIRNFHQNDGYWLINEGNANNSTSNNYIVNITY